METTSTGDPNSSSNSDEVSLITGKTCGALFLANIVASAFLIGLARRQNKIEWQRYWDVLEAFAFTLGCVTCIFLAVLLAVTASLGKRDTVGIRRLRYRTAVAWVLICFISCTGTLLFMMVFGG